MYGSHSSDFGPLASELSTENLPVRFVSLTSTKSHFDLLCHYVGSGRCWPSWGHSACLVLRVHALPGGGASACASVVEGPGQEVSSLCRQVSTCHYYLTTSQDSCAQCPRIVCFSLQTKPRHPKMYLQQQEEIEKKYWAVSACYHWQLLHEMIDLVTQKQRLDEKWLEIVIDV